VTTPNAVKPSIPRVSVLMTVYNAAAYLRDSVGSILAQTFPDWELIVVDDGSTDGSREVLASYSDPRVRVFALPTNIGRTPALRHAFSHVRGEYIAVLDADDISRPERLEKQVSYLDRHPDTVLVGTWAEFFGDDGRIIASWTPKGDAQSLRDQLAQYNPVVHSSSMYRANVALDVQGYPEEFRYAQDYALWLKLAARGEIGMIEENLCRFRIVATSMTRGVRFRIEVARDQLELLLLAGRSLPLTKQARRKNREEVTIARVRYGVALMRKGSLLQGLSSIALAVVRNPLRLISNRVVRDLVAQRRLGRVA